MVRRVAYLVLFFAPALVNAMSTEQIIQERFKKNEEMKSYVAKIYKRDRTIPKALPFDIGIQQDKYSVSLYGFRTDVELPSIYSSFSYEHLDGKFLYELAYEVNGQVLWSCETNISRQLLPQDKNCSYKPD